MRGTSELGNCRCRHGLAPLPMLVDLNHVSIEEVTDLYTTASSIGLGNSRFGFCALAFAPLPFSQRSNLNLHHELSKLCQRTNVCGRSLRSNRALHHWRNKISA
jgi:hypothetical protein